MILPHSGVYSFLLKICSLKQETQRLINKTCTELNFYPCKVVCDFELIVNYMGASVSK